MTDRDRLKDALKHEDAAIRLYRQFADETEDARLKEMFTQFAMNESWHAAAIRDKLGQPESRNPLLTHLTANT